MEAGGPFPVIEKDFINLVESKPTDFRFGVMTFKSTGTIRTDAKIHRVLSVLPTRVSEIHEPGHRIPSFVHWAP